MNKEIEDTLSVTGKKSVALILGALSGVAIIALSIYLVLTKGDTGVLWPLIGFAGGCLGFGAAESNAAKKWGST